MLNPTVTAIGMPAAREVYSSAVKVSRPANVSTFTFATIPIMGGSIGANGWLEVKAVICVKNTADVGTRTLVVNLGASSLKSWGSIATQNNIGYIFLRMWNRNSQSSQVLSATNDNATHWVGVFTNGDATGDDSKLIPLGGSVNTANDLNLTIQHTSINASDTAILQSLSVSVFKQA